MATNNQSIVIKKIKKGGHAAHGGAWKVAYADFVTAMMAFFLLLWLLNATEAEKLAGLADFFAPTVGVAGNMGIGFRGGKSILSKGIGADKSTNKGIIFAAPTQGTVVKNPEEIESENTLPEQEKIQIVEKQGTNEELKDVQDSITKEFAENSELREFRSNVLVQNTPEGLKIEISNTKDNPMFGPGESEPNESAKKILKKIAEIVTLLPNYVSIVGHTDSLTIGRGKDYTNWELSADRANAVRRFLIENEVVKEQISQVIGKADNDPIDTVNPDSPVNNSVDIILLNNAYLTPHKKGASEEIFVDPEAAKKDELMEVEPQKKEEAPTLEQTPLPETKGRNFFEGITGEGIEYESVDPEKAKATVVPGGFFTKETPASEVLDNPSLFGEGNTGPVEDVTEDKLKGTPPKIQKFEEKKIDMESQQIQDVPTIDPAKEKGGVLPGEFFNNDNAPIGNFSDELFGTGNEGPLEPIDDAFEKKKALEDKKAAEKNKENEKINKKKQFFEEDLEKLPTEDGQGGALPNGGDTSMPPDFFGQFGF